MPDESPDGGRVEGTGCKPNRHTARVLVNSVPEYHRLGDRLYRTVEIAEEDWHLDTLVHLERTRRERSDAWTGLMRSLDDDVCVQVVVSILRDSPQTYASLAEQTEKTKRTVRDRVYTLRDRNVVEVEGRPAAISFVDDDVRLLASDVLSFVG